MAVDARWMWQVLAVSYAPVLPPFAPAGCTPRGWSQVGGGGARLGSGCGSSQMAALVSRDMRQTPQTQPRFRPGAASSFAEGLGSHPEPHPSQSVAAVARARC